jgi:hypothetical protein
LAFELIGDCHPSGVPEREIELLRTQTLSALQVSLTQPEVIADREFRRACMGRIPTPGA